MATLEEVKTKYTKQYLPGYTGHVPAKNDLFGLTAGEANRLIQRTSLGQKTSLNSPTLRDTRTFVKFQNAAQLKEAHQSDSIKFGNLSRGAKNWISGPNHQIYNQHVPGYTGHVPGIVAENLFAKSYAKTTASALHGEFSRGYDLPLKARYRSQSQCEYSPLNFRRYIENPRIQQNKDYEDYYQFVQGKNVVTINAEGRAGWSTHDEGFPSLPDQKVPASTRHKRAQSIMDPVCGSPVAMEKNFKKNSDFARLSDGFKRVMCGSEDQKKLSLPIVGYAGHQKGVMARNFYGKSFRESSLASKRVLRQTLAP